MMASSEDLLFKNGERVGLGERRLVDARQVNHVAYPTLMENEHLVTGLFRQTWEVRNCAHLLYAQ